MRGYSFEELFAEKLWAMGQRGRPRDLYDIVNLFRRNDLRLHARPIRDVLVGKCAVRSVEVPTLASVAAAPHRAELESEWANMLGDQLAALPPLDQFLYELPDLFFWLHGEAESPELVAIGSEADEDLSWSPPPTAVSRRQGVPFCQKEFRRQRQDTTLRPHNDRYGYACSGRRGYLVRTQYG